MDKMIGIYGIHNIANNKWYVGQSQDIHKRIVGHKNLLKNNHHSNRHLQRSYNTYGEENFKYEILELCTLDELDDAEMKWIDIKMSKENGYNMTDGGGGMRGYHFSDEVKQKMSESRKGRTVSEETREKLSKIKSGEGHHMYGKHHSEEAKEKIRQGNMGIRVGVPRPEHVANILRTNGIGKESFRRKAVRCVETQEVFVSISHAANAVGKTHSTLSVALKNGKTCAGYHWEYYIEPEENILKEVS